MQSALVLAQEEVIIIINAETTAINTLSLGVFIDMLLVTKQNGL